MLSLLRKPKPYTGRHADDERAPKGTACIDCGGTEPPSGVLFGEDDRPLKLTRCSMCETWRCTTCYSQHTYTPLPVLAAPKAPWWKRVLGRG